MGDDLAKLSDLAMAWGISMVLSGFTLFAVAKDLFHTLPQPPPPPPSISVFGRGTWGHSRKWPVLGSENGDTLSCVIPP